MTEQSKSARQKLDNLISSGAFKTEYNQKQTTASANTAATSSDNTASASASASASGYRDKDGFLVVLPRTAATDAYNRSVQQTAANTAENMERKISEQKDTVKQAGSAYRSAKIHGEDTTETLNAFQSAKNELANLKQTKEYNKQTQYAQKGQEALSKLDDKTISLLDDYNSNRNGEWVPFSIHTDKVNLTSDITRRRTANKELHSMGYSDKEIEQLADYRWRVTSEAEYNKVKEATEYLAKQGLGGAIGTSAASVISNLGQGAGIIDATVQKIRNAAKGYSDRPVNYNSTANQSYAITTGARDTIAQKLTDQGKTTGAFLYQTGMSMVDSTVNIALAAMGLPEGIGLALMGGSAATAAMHSAKQRGVSDWRAITTGLAAGVAEALFEKVSLEGVLDPKMIISGTGKQALKSFVTNTFKQMVAEGSEEGATTLANTVTDAIINGDLSEYQQTLQQYAASNMDATTASRKAFADWFQGLALDIAGGALSGGIMGAASVTWHTAKANKMAVKYYTGNEKALLDMADSVNLDNKYTQKLKDNVKNGVNSDGPLLRSVAQYAIKERMTQDLKEKTAFYENVLKESGESTEDANKFAEVLAKYDVTTSAMNTKAPNGDINAFYAMSLGDVVGEVSKSRYKAALSNETAGRILTALRTGDVENYIKSSEDLRSMTKENEVQQDAESARTALSDEIDKVVSYESFAAAQNQSGENVSEEKVREDYNRAVDTFVRDAIKINAFGKDMTFSEFRMVASNLAKKNGESYTVDELRLMYDKVLAESGITADQIRTAQENRQQELKKQAEENRGRMENLMNNVNKAFEKRGLGFKAEISYDEKMFAPEENAFVRNGVIVFNGNRITTEFAVLYTLGHELVHPASDADAGLVGEIIDTFKLLEERGALESKLAARVRNSDATIEHIRKMYQAHENYLADKENARRETEGIEERVEAKQVDKAYAEQEFAADLMRELFMDTKLCNEIMGINPTLGQKIMDKIRKIRMAVRGSDAKEVADALDKLYDRFDSALNEQGHKLSRMTDKDVEHSVAAENVRAQKNTAQTSGIKFSLDVKDGFAFVYPDRRVITGDDASEWGKQVENFINESIRKGHDVVLPTTDNHILILTGRSAYKLTDRHISSATKKIRPLLSDEEYSRKMRVAAHIDEIIKVGFFTGYKDDNGTHENDVGEDGFNYFRAYFRDLDNKYYLIPFSSALNDSDETAYSIGKIKERKDPTGSGSSTKSGGALIGSDLSYGDSNTGPTESQVKTAIQIAFEKALAKKSSSQKHSRDTEYLDLSENGIVDKEIRVQNERNQRLYSQEQVDRVTDRFFNEIDGLESRRSSLTNFEYLVPNDPLYPESERDQHAFDRDLATKTTALKNGEKKNIIVYTKDDMYFFKATGYMSGKIIAVKNLNDGSYTTRKEDVYNGYGEREISDPVLQGLRDAKAERDRVLNVFGYRAEAGQSSGVDQKPYYRDTRRSVRERLGIVDVNTETEASEEGASFMPERRYSLEDDQLAEYERQMQKDDELFQKFVEKYESENGAGSIDEAYATLEQQLRAARRELKREQQKRASAQAAKSVAEANSKAKLDDNALAWAMYSKRMRLQDKHRYENKLAEQKDRLRREKAEALSAQKDIYEAKLDMTEQAERMNAMKKMAKALRLKDDAYGKLKEKTRQQLKLKTNAGGATVKTKTAADARRNQIQTEQGPVDSLRKNPALNKETKDLKYAAKKLRTLGRKAYETFVSGNLATEQFSNAQVGMRADTLSTVLGASKDTVERIFKKGLVNKSGDRIADSMQEVFLCWNSDHSEVDEPMQELLQNYMLHLHNIDRMSFVSNALNRVEAFEAANPWVSEMDKKEFALLVNMTDKETARLGKQEARDIAREYAALLAQYNKAKDKPVAADANGNPITADTSRKIVADIEAANPWVSEKANGIYEWWDTFMKEWVVGSSITAEDYALMREMYPHYVPTYRQDKGIGGAVLRNGTTISPGKVVKKAIGGTSDIVNIEDSFANLVSKAIRVERFNELAQNIVGTIMLDEDGIFSGFGVFDWDNMNSYEDADGNVKTVAKEGETDERMDAAESVGLVKTKKGEYKLTAWFDGELRSAYISEDLYNSLSYVAGYSKDRLDKLTRVGNALTGPMKTAITGINPLFAIRNISRDIPTAIVNSISGLAFPKYLVSSVKNMAKNSELWMSYQALGGTHSGYYNNEKGFAQVMAEKENIFGKITGALGWFNEATEAMTRFAEFLATVDRLGDTYENRLTGIKNAAEVTVDFSRTGTYGKAINAWVPYWNPAVQGIDKVIRSVFQTKDGETIIRQAMKTGGRAMMTTVVLDAILFAIRAMTSRDDDWAQLSDRVKDTYYCIPIPGKEHEFFLIPKNREWGAILGAPFSRLMEAAFYDRENPFEDYLETSIEPNFLPGAILRYNVREGRIESDIIGVSQALDLAYNEDFAGRSIIPYAYENLLPEDQYNNETSYLSTALGKLFKFSPMAADYIIQDYLGDFGDILTTLTTPATVSGDANVAKNIWDAFTGSFVKDNRYSNKVTSKYYDTLGTLEKEVNAIKLRNPDGYEDTIEYKTQKAMSKLYGKQISAINAQIKDLPDGEEKDELKGQIVAIATEAMDYYEKCMSGSIKEPLLEAEYASLDSQVSSELIRLNNLATDYSFTPATSYSTKTITDPNNKNKVFVLDDEAKAKRMEIYTDLYESEFLRITGTTKYMKATDIRKAEMLEEMKENVTSRTGKEFKEWLTKNRRSTNK